MRKTLAWVAGIFIAGGFIWFAGSVLTAPTKVARPEFVPGQRVLIHLGNRTIEGTLVLPNIRVMEAFDALDSQSRRLANDNGARG